MNSKVKVKDQAGYIFISSAGESPCFVPEDCVMINEAGRVSVDELKYFCSGWSVRNGRWSDADSGATFLFPEQSRLVHNCESPQVQKFLTRIARSG